MGEGIYNVWNQSETLSQTRCQQSFSAKGQLINMLGFVGHTIAVGTAPLCTLV